MLDRDPKNAICKLGAHHLLSGAAEANNSSSAVIFAQNASCDKSKPIIVHDAEPEFGSIQIKNEKLASG
jgi:hypothetical protein